jgi:excisionase family DNA binding protein
MNRRMSTAQVARLLDVSGQSVANWIDQGQLRAARTPGGHRRVETQDLLGFLRRQKFRVPPELEAGGAPTILVVDDDPGVGAWLQKTIQQERPDSRVLLASDGYSAGEITVQEKPDLVILDLYMPGLDGFAVCQKIKSRPATRDIVVVVITAHPSPEAEKAALKAGASAYLVKPLEIQTLRDVLLKHLPTT